MNFSKGVATIALLAAFALFASMSASPQTLINLARGVTGILPCTSFPVLTGDTTTSSGSCGTTTAKINGTSFAGTSGHVVGFGAANIPTDTGIVYANIVTASSPGAGLCHFAGSTQVCTSSAVVGSDMTNNTVTSTQEAVVNTRRVCDAAIGDASGSAITSAQLGPQKRICYIPAAATIVEMDVAADAGTPNAIVAVDHAGSNSNIVSAALATGSSGAIACSKTTSATGIDGATTCTNTLQNTSIAAGDYLELVSGTAGGTAKLMTIHVIYTIN